MKISLDHQALSLLFKDAEWALQFKDSVLKWCVEKHLSNFVPETFQNMWNDRIKLFIEKLLDENIGKIDERSFYRNEFKISESMQLRMGKLREQIFDDCEIRTSIRERILQFIDKQKVEAAVRTFIESTTYDYLQINKPKLLEEAKAQLIVELREELKEQVLAEFLAKHNK